MRAINKAETPQGVLETALSDSDDFDSVLVVVSKKDGTHTLICSHTSFHIKTSLVAFAQYWIHQWFVAGEQR